MMGWERIGQVRIGKDRIGNRINKSANIDRKIFWEISEIRINEDYKLININSITVCRENIWKGQDRIGKGGLE